MRCVKIKILGTFSSDFLFLLHNFIRDIFMCYIQKRAEYVINVTVITKYASAAISAVGYVIRRLINIDRKRLSWSVVTDFALLPKPKSSIVTWEEIFESRTYCDVPVVPFSSISHMNYFTNVSNRKYLPVAFEYTKPYSRTL